MSDRRTIEARGRSQKTPMPRTRFACRVACLLMVTIGLAARANAGPVAVDVTRLRALVDGAVADAMRDDHIAGVAVAIVDRSGTVLTRGYGVASVSPDRPADADTLFRVGSISKTVVWISVMQLVEAGKISLDDPINSHLPADLRVPDEGFSHPILVRHLMTHTAGFEDSVLQTFERDPSLLQPLEEFLRTHRGHRVREPGTVSVYSNYGTALAAAMVAYMSGQSWQDYAEQRVLRPLGMKAATYREPYPQALARTSGLVTPMPKPVADEVSEGFSYDSEVLRPQAFEYITNGAPAGSLSASANEMALFARALLDPQVMAGAGVLRADTAMSLREPLFGNDPQLGSWRHGFMDFTAHRGRVSFGHHGDIIYQHATLEIYPEAGVGIFVAVNTPTGTRLLDTLPNTILDALGVPAAAHAPRAADAKAQASRVAGVYLKLLRPSFRTERALMRFFAFTTVSVLPDGDIVQGGERYAAIGDGLFESATGSDRIAFREVGGHMRLYDSLNVWPADRVGFLEGRTWLELTMALGILAAVLCVLAGLLRLFKGSAPDPAAALVIELLALLWLGSFGFFLSALKVWLSDSRSVVFTYPGTLFPIACWLFLVASIATPIATLVSLGPLHTTPWGRWRWARHGISLALFLVLSATLYAWGFLGFSAW